MSWINSKFNGKCKLCGASIPAGSSVWFYGRHKGVACRKCMGGDKPAHKPAHVPVPKDDVPVHVERRFETWGEFIRASMKGSDWERGSSHKGGRAWEWDLGVSYDKAIEFATKGWPAGLAKVKGIVERIDKVIGSKIMVHEPMLDVTGLYVDVGEFLTGSPECMVRLEQAERDGVGRVLKLVINCAASRGIDAGVIERRGAAVASLVDGLELAGRSVEVELIQHISGSGGGDYTWKVMLKRAGEILDLDGIAFAIIHPTVLRRIGFGVEEGEPKDIRARFGFGSGFGWGLYGSPADVDEAERGDIYLGKMDLGAEQWETEEAATKWVEKTLQEQGVEFAA